MRIPDYYSEKLKRADNKAIFDAAAQQESENKELFNEGKAQPRNAKCACGSGLKYKNCCGKSHHMDMTLKKGDVIQFEVYSGNDENEYHSLLNLVSTAHENNFPLEFTYSGFNVKVLEIIKGGYVKDNPYYKIEIKGELV